MEFNDIKSMPPLIKARMDTIIEHVADLARLTGAELLLVHVADGFGSKDGLAE